MVISPTVGRVVWYRPSESDRVRMNVQGDQPLKADIVYVHGDRLVNLHVIDHSGRAHAVCAVTLVQNGDLTRVAGCYCEWPAKHAAVSETT